MNVYEKHTFIYWCSYIFIMTVNKLSLEQRFEKLKCVMVDNLETLHDMIMDQLDESEEYYDAFEVEYNNMIKAVEGI